MSLHTLQITSSELNIHVIHPLQNKVKDENPLPLSARYNNVTEWQPQTSAAGQSRQYPQIVLIENVPLFVFKLPNVAQVFWWLQLPS